MAVVLQHEVVWEVWDNFQKQTYRNRCYIATDQGRHMLNLPISHVGGPHGRQPYRDVRIDPAYPWQRQHWRGLETAYRSAPFFEYYEADLRPVFERPFDRLLDLNLATIQSLCSLLKFPFPEERTSAYRRSHEHLCDGRDLVLAKKERGGSLPVYTQVFQERHGFLSNLSTLDLLFNEGPSAREYLQTIELPLDV